MASKTQLNDNQQHSSQHSNEELFQLIAHQTQYIDQLEKENEIIVTELENFKEQLVQVVNENQSIHDAMQAKVVEETLQQSTTMRNDPNLFKDDHTAKNLNISTSNAKQVETQLRENMNEKWKAELKTVEGMYAAKIAVLEARLAQHIRINTNKNITLMKNQLESQEAQETEEPDTSPMQNFNAPVMEKLTRENDQLLKTVKDLRKAVTESQKQEAALRKDLQKSIGALEDIQLEKTQIMVKREQLQDDLDVMKRKLEKEITCGRQSITEAVAKQRDRSKDEIEKLQAQIGEAENACSQFEVLVETMRKEKLELELKLEESRGQIMRMDKELATMRAEVEVEIKSALKGHNATDSQLRNNQARLQNDMFKVSEERSELEQKVVDLNRRLRDAESHSLNLQELNLSLTQQLNEITSKHRSSESYSRQLEEKYIKHLQELTEDHQDKTEQLTTTLEGTQLEYEQRLSDLEAISSKQAKLLLKLREECKNLEDGLQNMSEKYRTDMGRVSQENEQMFAKVQRLSTANKELSAQCVKHGLTHRAMRQRLDELNVRAHRSTGQVLNLLDQQLTNSTNNYINT
nr:serologically defined colon cancer antigen 8 homolog [Ciona intestinalis]|eukprot:XP_002120666.1 serologically defined colon cancer antigen 8 homolog [Ciona intestinalis]